MRSLSNKKFAAFALASLLARPVLAQQASARLSWNAPAKCPSEATFRGEVLALAGSPSAHEQIPSITVSVVVTQLANGTWQARVATLSEGRRGARLVRDARCADVAHAVALIVALTLNPVADGSISEPSAPPATAPRAPHFSWGLDAIASSGTVPGLGLATQTRLALELDPLALELRMAFFFPESERSAAAPRARMEIVAAELAVAACYGRTLTLRVALQGCAGLNVTGIHAASSGVAEPGSVTGIWPSPLLEAVARVALSERLGLRFAAQGARSLQAPRFAVAGDGTFFRPAAVTFRLGLGAELHF